MLETMLDKGQRTVKEKKRQIEREREFGVECC